jgi:hypothetical protein
MYCSAWGSHSVRRVHYISFFLTFDRIDQDVRLPPNPIILGFCTGLLPAAVAATVTSSAQFLKLAPEVVCISLRLAIGISRRSTEIELSSESWATAIMGISASEMKTILDEFHAIKVRIIIHRYAPIAPDCDRCSQFTSMFISAQAM